MKKEGLLQKRQKDLSKSENEAMKVAVGVTGRPFPVFETNIVVNKSGEHVAREELRILEDDSNPLYIYSERPYDEVMGILYRNMPSPSMSEIFMQGLMLRRPESKRRIQYVKGEPGAGKSFMGKLHGSLRSRRGALVVDCGGKNLAELLYETVLDFENDKTFFSELDKRLASGKLNPASLNILKQALGSSAYEEDENGNIAVDWARLGNAETVEGRDPDYMEKLRRSLSDISALEGLDQFGGNALGLVTKEGPLIAAYKEGREIVLDEYNKSKEGTDDSLQTVLQFLAGEIDVCVVENRLKSKGDEKTHSFTFDRADMKPGFFVTATGNAIEDGITTRPLSKSANSRLQPVMMPKATEMDWQHRWCQILMDVPLSTFYLMGRRGWDGDKKAFRKFLRYRLTAGRSAEEIANIPEHHFAFADNWERVLAATRMLAKFCEKVANLLDPDSGKYTGEGFDDILAEIEEGEFTDEVSFDFRKIIKYVEMAMEDGPRSKPRSLSNGFDISEWKEPAKLAPRQKEPFLLNFGSRLVEAMTKDVINISHKRGKPATFRQLMTWQKAYGLIGADLKEAQEQSGNMVSELLNISPYHGHDIEAQAEILQRIMSDELRRRYPDLDKNDDKLVSLQRIQAALMRLEESDLNALLAEHDPRFKEDFNQNAGMPRFGNGFILLNMDKKSCLRTPFTITSTYDTTPFHTDYGIVQPKLPEEVTELATEQDVLQTLVLPVIGRKNLQAMWTQRIDTSNITPGSDKNEALAMAQSKHSSGLAITTIHVDVNGEKKAVHIVRNIEKGKTIIVGHGIDDRLKEIFAHCKIEYFDRNDPTASGKLRNALVEVADRYAHKVETSLKMAFLMRNQSKIDPSQDLNRPLAELMLAEDVEAFIDHVVPKRSMPLRLNVA